MASPTVEIFFVYNLSTGVPLTGQAGSMSFDVYKDTSGTNLSQPAITEIGTSGVYKFTPVFADPTKGIVYILNTGAGGNPARIARFMRPEDYITDNITDIQTVLSNIKEYQQGKWQIFTSGGDNFRMVFYDTTGSTVLAKYDLADDSGAPTTTNVFKRTKV